MLCCLKVQHLCHSSYLPRFKNRFTDPKIDFPVMVLIVRTLDFTVSSGEKELDTTCTLCADFAKFLKHVFIYDCNLLKLHKNMLMVLSGGKNQSGVPTV